MQMANAGFQKHVFMQSAHQLYSFSTLKPKFHTMTSNPPTSFTQKQQNLLSLEQSQEIDLSKQSSRVLVSLCEVETEVTGKYLVKVKMAPTGQLKIDSPKMQRNLSTGTCVSLLDKSNHRDETPLEGVVKAIENRLITIVMKNFYDDWYQNDLQQLEMALVPDETTYKRYSYVLNDMTQSANLRHCRKIIDVAFGNDKPQFVTEDEDRDGLFNLQKYYNNYLNESQKEAVRFAISTKNMACILGPPGTGKTTTIAEVIKQAVFLLKQRILVVAPSNIAIDNIVERLDNGLKKPKMVRLGHPARLMDSVLKHSLDYQLNHGEGSKVVADIKKEMNKILAKLSKTRSKAKKRQLWGEMKLLRKDLRSRERQAVEEIVKHSQVVLCTCSGAYARTLRDVKFDLVVIDEAAQALEVACWLALIRGERAILAGDPFQLAPTVMSPEAERKGLAVTLFERLYKKHKEGISRMLTTQYRMNSQIMQWSSDEFYDGELVADDSVADHLLCDMEPVSEEEQTLMPLFFIDTANCGFEEAEESGSKCNKDEVTLVEKHLDALLEAGVAEGDIGIITPYSAQVQLLRSSLAEEHPFVEINTVDAYQGREKEAIIISLVRSNKKGEVGFLSDERRLNVAITRARRHVCLVGNSTTLRTNKFLSRMVEYFNTNADVRQAFDYM